MSEGGNEEMNWKLNEDDNDKETNQIWCIY